MATKHIHRQRITAVIPWLRKTDGYETDSLAETEQEKMEMLADCIDELFERIEVLEGKLKDYENR